MIWKLRFEAKKFRVSASPGMGQQLVFEHSGLLFWAGSPERLPRLSTPREAARFFIGLQQAFYVVFHLDLQKNVCV